jgi:ribonuclease HI
VYTAELSGIEIALAAAANKDQYMAREVMIFSDSQAAIQAV